MANFACLLRARFQVATTHGAAAFAPIIAPSSFAPFSFDTAPGFDGYLAQSGLLMADQDSDPLVDVESESMDLAMDAEEKLAAEDAAAAEAAGARPFDFGVKL